MTPWFSAKRQYPRWRRISLAIFSSDSAARLSLIILVITPVRASAGLSGGLFLDAEDGGVLGRA